MIRVKKLSVGTSMYHMPEKRKNFSQYGTSPSGGFGARATVANIHRTSHRNSNIVTSATAERKGPVRSRREALGQTRFRRISYLALSPTTCNGTCKLARNELWYIILGRGYLEFRMGKQSETCRGNIEQERARNPGVYAAMKPTRSRTTTRRMR